MSHKIEELIIRYASGLVPYREFRAAFAPLFLSAGRSEADEIAIQVESLCADCSEGLISEDALRQKLGRLWVLSSGISQFELSFQPSAGNSLNVPASGNSGLNNGNLGELFELEPVA